MRKIKSVTSTVLIITMLFACCSCKANETTSTLSGLTMNDYRAIEDGEAVVLEGYVQDKESLREATYCSFYIQTNDGGAYVYEAAVGEQLYSDLKEGTHVRVSGTKVYWSGLPEIKNATVEIVGKDTFMAPYIEIGGLKEPSVFLNARVQIENATVKVMSSGKAVEHGFADQGKSGDSLYFCVSGGSGNSAVTVNCIVDTNFVQSGSEIYTLAEGLTEGRSVSVSGVLSLSGDSYLIRITGITIK